MNDKTSDKAQVLALIEKYKIVPVVKIDAAKETVPLLKAFVGGGVNCAEITYRTKFAEEAIKTAVKNFPEMLVGAGSVIDKKQAESAHNSGAKFIVGPGFSCEVADFCLQKGLLYLPGCVTPTEIINAVNRGIMTVKFFPANIYGGLNGIKSLSSPFPSVRFIPTGGIDGSNLADYLSFEKIAACGGSWLCPEKLVKTEKFDEIEQICFKSSQIVAGLNAD